MKHKITKLIFAIFLFSATAQCSQFKPFTFKQDGEYQDTNLPSAPSDYPDTSTYQFLHGYFKGKTYPTYNISEDELSSICRLNKRLSALESEKSKQRELDAECNSDEETRLLLAVKNNFNFLALYLLDRGADPTKSDRKFTRPLDIAKKNNNQYLIDILECTINSKVKQSKDNKTYYLQN